MFNAALKGSETGHITAPSFSALEISYPAPACSGTYILTCTPRPKFALRSVLLFSLSSYLQTPDIAKWLLPLRFLPSMCSHEMGA